jgi:hypothetical protein
MAAPRPVHESVCRRSEAPLYADAVRLPTQHASVAANTLSKSAGVRSRQVSAVCDLQLRPGPVLRGRPRTAANETRTETGAAPVPKGFQERPWFMTSHSCYLHRWHPGTARPARSSRAYPAPGGRTARQGRDLWPCG